MNKILFEFNYLKMTFLLPFVLIYGFCLVLHLFIFLGGKLTKIIGEGDNIFKSEINKKKLMKKVHIFFLGFSLLISLLMSGEYITVSRSYRNNNYNIVEGYIQNFEPAKTGMRGTPPESFDINGIHFFYDEGIISCGYNRTWRNDGVIRENGQHLKIGYVDTSPFGTGNVIVYIEQLDDEVQ